MSWICAKAQAAIASGELSFPTKPVATDGCKYHFIHEDPLNMLVVNASETTIPEIEGYAYIIFILTPILTHHIIFHFISQRIRICNLPYLVFMVYITWCISNDNCILNCIVHNGRQQSARYKSKIIGAFR